MNLMGNVVRKFTHSLKVLQKNLILIYFQNKDGLKLQMLILGLISMKGIGKEHMGLILRTLMKVYSEISDELFEMLNYL